MSYTFLLAQGEESSAESFSDMPAYVLSKLSHIAEKSCSNVNETESCHDSQFGMTCEHLTAGRGATELTLRAEGSHVRTSVAPVLEKELTAPEAGCGSTCSGWFAKLNPDTSLWRTPQCLLFEDLEQSLAIWPRRGTMLNGECFHVPNSERPTYEKEFSFWPTLNASGGWRSDGELVALNRLNIPEGELMAFTHRACRSKKRKFLPTLTICGNYNRKGSSKTSGDGLYTAIGGRPNPEWEEWFMGWPIGWTALTPLGMDKFQQWLSSHGKH